jgi:hypothetical protein
VYNGDGQVIASYNGNTLLWGDTITGSLYAVTYDVVIDYGYPALGTYHSMNPRTVTYDNKGDTRYFAEVYTTGNTWRMPNWNINNFVLGSATLTSRVVNYSNINVPNGERVTWANVLGNYSQTPNGSTSGSFTHTGLALNTKYTVRLGMVANNTSGPILGNAYGDMIVYPAYTTLSKGSITASRNTTTPSTVRVNWGAWGTFGNLSGWSGNIQFLDSESGSVIKTQAINSTVAGYTDVVGLPLDKNLNVRIVLSGKYHDGTTKNEYSATVELGYLNNTYIKVGGVWKKGDRTYIKVKGIWKANNTLVKHKVSDMWK